MGDHNPLLSRLSMNFKFFMLPRQPRLVSDYRVTGINIATLVNLFNIVISLYLLSRNIDDQSIPLTPAFHGLGLRLG